MLTENRKCTKLPQSDLKHLTVKSTQYTFNTDPRGPNFTQFRSTNSRFRDTNLPKTGNAPNYMYPQNDLNQLSKGTRIH